MKKVNLKFIVSTIILMLIISIASAVKAANGSLTVKITPDASKAITEQKVYLTLSLKDFNNVETTWPMAAEGNLEYDKTIFSNVSIKGLNGWSASINQSGKILLDTSSVKENTDIAKITLTIKDSKASFTTDIKVNSFALTNGTDSEDNENVNIENMNLTAKVTVTINSSDEEDDTEKPGEDEDKTEDDDSENKDDTDKPTDEDNKQDENVNNNQNNSENNNEQSGIKNETKGNTIEKVEDLSVAKDPIPQTGVNYTIVGVISIIIIVAIIAFIRYKKFYD